MYRNDPFRGGGWSSWGGAPSRDILVLLGVVFATFSLQFFNATAIVPAALRLTPAAWRYGFLWQLFTYPFVGIGGASLWFLLALLMIYMFGRDVFFQLGRRNFWKLTLWSCVPAAVVGLAVDGVMRLTGGVWSPFSLVTMQGQWMLLAILVAAYATLNRNATILLFFIIPVPARWYLWLEILFAFLAFLQTKDLAGFLGLCAGVGCTYAFIVPGGWRRLRRDSWLRLQAWWLRQKMNRLRRKRGFTVVGRDDRYIH